MKRWRLYLALLLCPCISVQAMPVFEEVAIDESATVEELSDSQMESLVGSGNVDVEMSDYKQGGGVAKGKIANRTTLYFNYELNTTDMNGNVQETLASGSIAPGEAIIVTGMPGVASGSNNKYVQLRAFNTGMGALEAIDTSWAPVSIDSDGDGILDEIELANGMNPYDPADATADFDGDGLTNKEELLTYGTNINSTDTDGDTIDDAAELAMNFDPTDPNDGLADPDMDYLSTAQELAMGTDPEVANPGLVADTDGDGVNDTLENRLGMDAGNAEIASVGGDTENDKHLVHVLNRLTFGPTVDTMNEASSMGLSNWIQGQLAPLSFANLLDDPAQMLREDNPYQPTHEERHGAIRPVHSVKHIQARMGLFWDNHFSTYKNVVNNYDSEMHEEDLFFVHALGNFRTLLDASAKSDAMMRYLDLRISKQPQPNENYAREVMELHTFGVTTTDVDDSGQPFYGPDDVDALSHILSGWSTGGAGTPSRYTRRHNDGSFSTQTLFEFIFRGSNHSTEPKNFLGVDFPGTGGQAEGELALDMLAEHPQTAKNICGKMARTFVSDEPAPATLANCEAVFLGAVDAPDQMKQVLMSLVNSAEFNNADTRLSKFKDNQEYMISLARILRVNAVGRAPSVGYLDGTAFGEAIEATGQGLFDKGPPTGYKETAEQWNTTNSAIARFREGNELIFSYGYTDNIAAYFSDNGVTTSGGVMRELFKMMLGGEYGLDHMTMAYWELHPDGQVFDINENYASQRIENVIAKLAQLPEFNLH